MLYMHAKRGTDSRFLALLPGRRSLPFDKHNKFLSQEALQQRYEHHRTITLQPWRICATLLSCLPFPQRKSYYCTARLHVHYSEHGWSRGGKKAKGESALPEQFSMFATWSALLCPKMVMLVTRGEANATFY